MSYSGLVKKREIKKTVDELSINLPTPTINSKLNSSTKTNTTVSETQNKQLISDVITLTESAGETVQKIITEIQNLNTGDPIFDIYYKVLEKQFNPKNLPDNSSEIKDSPPSLALKVIERDIYRRQTDPRVILLGDMTKIKNQIGAIEYAYKDGYNIAFSNSSLVPSSSTKPLSKLLFQKDIQLIQNGLEYVTKYNNLGNSSLDLEFLNGISEMITRYSGDLNELGNQLSHLSIIQIDTLFDEFFSLKNSIENIIGDINYFALGKKKSAFNAAKLFGMADNVFDATRNLEKLGNTNSPNKKLLDVKESINQSLFNSLASVESELLSTEGKLLQTDESRQHIIKNIELSSTLKDFNYVIGSLTSLGDSISRINSNNIAYNITSILTQSSNLNSSIKTIIEAGRATKSPKINKNTELAAIVLKNWVDG